MSYHHTRQSGWVVAPILIRRICMNGPRSETTPASAHQSFGLQRFDVEANPPPQVLACDAIPVNQACAKSTNRRAINFLISYLLRTGAMAEQTPAPFFFFFFFSSCSCASCPSPRLASVPSTASHLRRSATVRPQSTMFRTCKCPYTGLPACSPTDQSTLHLQS